MLSKLIDAALRQRPLVMICTGLLLAAGIWSYLKLPIDAFPDVSSTQVKLVVKAPGMTPEEVEARITVPIEQEVLGIPRQTMLRSTSKYALADITLDFEEGTDVYWARQQVAERLAGIMKDLPPNASGGMAPITTPLGEMFMFTVEGPQSLEERRRVLDWVVRSALRTLPGVAEVNSLGGRVRTLEVVPRAGDMLARGLTLNQLEEALVGGNHNDGAGRLTAGEEALIVRAEGAIQSLDDARATVVRAAGGRVVRVGDVADVRFGELTRYGAVSRNGKGETVEGLVLGLRGANAREVVSSVKARLAALQPQLPPGMTIVPFYDRAQLVDRAVGTVGKALTEAVVLVVGLLLLFLGNVRAALVVALMLPLSALGTFLLMRYFGLSANLMSLGGLAIAIGMLVDGAVVVVESIETEFARPQALTHSKRGVVFHASKEVALPVLSGIAIIVIVFLPLLSLEGLEGKLFAPVALTIVFALLVSLVLSLLVVPVIASWMLRAGPAHEPWVMRRLAGLYDRVLGLALRHEKKVLAAAGCALLAAAGLFTVVGKSFMPTLDEGDMIVQLEKLPSIGLEQAVNIDQSVQRALLERVPEVQGIVARSGSDELGLDPMGLNQTDSFLVLKPRAEWRRNDKEWLTQELRTVLEEFPGVDATFTQPIDMRVSEMLTGARGDLAIKIYGTDLAQLGRLAAQVEKLVAGIDGAVDTLTVRNDGVQYLKIEIDRLAAGRLGLAADAIQADLRRWVEGKPFGLLHEEGRRTPIVMRGSEDLRNSVADFESLRLSTPDGGSVPLSAVARLRREGGPVKVDREMGQRFVVVQTNVQGRDLVGFVEEAQRAVTQQVSLPQGYRVAWGGQFENQQRAAQRLLLVVPLALALIFFILFSTFRSVGQALLVLANVPLALIGGIAGLVVAGEYLSVPASVGFIALLGIAVLNGVVLVSHFNQLLAQGRSVADAVVEGSKRRLRPVVMTAAISAGGLVPLLFATGPGSEIQKPLAIVVIGGLVSSTALTLVLLPLLFRRFGFVPARVADLELEPAAT